MARGNDLMRNGCDLNQPKGMENGVRLINI